MTNGYPEDWDDVLSDEEVVKRQDASFATRLADPLDTMSVDDLDDIIGGLPTEPPMRAPAPVSQYAPAPAPISVIDERAPRDIASDQIDTAVATLGSTDGVVRWPWRDLDELCGPIPPGHVAFIAASSGGGKTTFSASLIDAWLGNGNRMCVLPLETRDYEFRTRLACRRLGGVNADDVLSGELALLAAAGDAMAKRTLHQIADELERQADDRRLHVSGQRGVNLLALEHTMAYAAEHGFNIVLVDHIDHVEGDGRSGGDMAESQRVNKGLLDLAQRYNVIVICTTQLNFGATRGNKNKLARYAPPSLDDIWNPGKKVQVATQIIGLYRELRPDATPSELKAAREGMTSPQTVLAQDRMGIVAMKLRFRGRNEGNRIQLRFNYGTLEDMPR